MRCAVPNQPVPGTKTDQIRQRLLAGAQLDSHTAVAQYKVNRSLFTTLVRDMKRQGHVFTETRTGPTAPVRYQLAGTNGSSAQGPGHTSVVVEDPRTAFERATDALLGGEHLSGADMVDRFGAKPQTIGVVVSRLKEKGYFLEYDELEGHGKRWHVAGKGEPPPKGHRTSHKGSRPKMPAPELDAATEVVLVHRISDDEIEFAVAQGHRRWLATIKSCVE